MEGIYKGHDCDNGGYCWSTIELNNGDDFDFGFSRYEAENFEDAIGDRVVVTYEVRQFWLGSRGNDCMRQPVGQNVKIIAAKSGTGGNAAVAKEKTAGQPPSEKITPIGIFEAPYKMTKKGSTITITSTVDSLSILKVIANRGNCRKL